jgi:hypothetical protein
MKSFAALALTLLMGAQSARVPYPLPASGANSTTKLFIFDENVLSNDDSFTISTLQGLVSRTTPQIYRIQGETGAYSFWLNQTMAMWPQVTADYSLNNNLTAALIHFRSVIDGYVLSNLTDASSSTAITVCAAGNYVAVTSANEAAAIAAGLPLAYDVRTRDVLWAIETLNNTNGFIFSKNIIILQDPTKFSCLSDYAVFARAISWWDTSMVSVLSLTVLSSVNPPAAVLGWGSNEGETVAAVSVFGGYVHASDWSKNLDVLSSFEIQQLSQPYVAPPPEPTEPVHTVCFLMTDGDNIQWLENGFAIDPNFWASPDRGKVGLGWTVSPALIDLAPTIAQYLYSTIAANNASSHDYFVAGPSGIGYSNPDLWKSPSLLESFIEATSALAKRMDFGIVNILGQAYSEPAAAQFLADDNIDALFWYNYDNYAGLNGEITWVNGKPVIGARLQLWTGTFDDPASLVFKLALQSKNRSSSAGYSLIDAHVWSDNVTNVRIVEDALGQLGGFRIVTPEQFVKDVVANVPH